MVKTLSSIMVAPTIRAETRGGEKKGERRGGRKKGEKGGKKGGEAGKKKGKVFTGGSFRKGVRVPIGVPGGGVWGRVEGGWWGAGFPVESKGNEEGGGEGGVGTRKGTGKSIRKLCRNYPLAKYPLASPRTIMINHSSSTSQSLPSDTKLSLMGKSKICSLCTNYEIQAYFLKLSSFSKYLGVTASILKLTFTRK